MEKKDIALMEISKIIVHDVPKHKTKDTSPQINYSERESHINIELCNFFKDRLIEIINNKCFKVIFNPSIESKVHEIINCLIKPTPREDIIIPSQLLAKHLYDIQTGNNPAGILVIIEGSISKKNVLCILKLERDEGAKLEKNATDNFTDIVFIKELIMTKKTKLYKAAIFFNREDFSTDFDGFVSDNQIQPTSKDGIASFFIFKYLNCQFYDDTRRVTKQFFEVTKDYITKVEDPVKRAKYYEHLISYNTRATNIIDVKEFIREFIDLEDRQEYENYIKENNLNITVFPRDTELIDKHLKKMMIDFDNDISLIVKNGELGDKVKLTNENDGMTKAEILAKIKSISS